MLVPGDVTGVGLLEQVHQKNRVILVLALNNNNKSAEPYDFSSKFTYICVYLGLFMGLRSKMSQRRWNLFVSYRQYKPSGHVEL